VKVTLAFSDVEPVIVTPLVGLLDHKKVNGPGTPSSLALPTRFDVAPGNVCADGEAVGFTVGALLFCKLTWITSISLSIKLPSFAVSVSV
jgi:hypothetical protein